MANIALDSLAASATIPDEGQPINGQGGNMARYRFQRGSLFLRGKCERVWVGRWREDVIVDGQVRRVKRSEVLGEPPEMTRRLAERELEKRLAEVNDPRYTPRYAATFTQFADRWEAKVLPNWKPSGKANAQCHLRKYLVPFFGKMQLRDVRPEVVQQFVASLSVSPKTVRNLVMTLRSLWRTAKAWGYVSHNVFDGLELPNVEKAERFFLSLGETERVLAAAEEPHRTFYWLAYETGLRAGELCGLRLDDLDVENCVLLVRKSVWEGKLQSPKSRAAMREAAISPELAEHLGQFLRAWRPNAQRLLFATRKGTPWNAKNVWRRNLRSLLRQLEIDVPKGNGLHAFRHGNATEMDRRGVPLAIRQRRLGHADAGMTLGTYTHAVSEDERRFVGELGKKLAPLGPKLPLEAMPTNGQVQ